jgi:hypothetical protein
MPRHSKDPPPPPPRIPASTAPAFMAEPEPSPQPTAPPVTLSTAMLDLEPAPDYVTVTALSVAFKRRGPFVFTAKPQTVRVADLGPTVYAQICADPALRVEEGSALDLEAERRGGARASERSDTDALRRELEEAKARIAQLEAQLALRMASDDRPDKPFGGF